MIPELEVQEIWKQCFGGHIRCLWYSVDYPMDTVSVAQQKAAFFWLTERWLREGKIRFTIPRDLTDARSALGRLSPIAVDPKTQRHELLYWDETPDVILDFMKSAMPSTEDRAEEDDIMNALYIDFPYILWVDADGVMHGS
jgi:hypothetical protein